MIVYGYIPKWKNRRVLKSKKLQHEEWLVSMQSMTTNFSKTKSKKTTGATNLHMSGISMRELMDQLRHTQLHSTQHYLKKHCGIVNNRIRDNFPSPI